ncbi:MAG: O-methyltransferase [Planctomycetes bacterium]|nr:O-methyltransferase [Planctomycetota bacterium]
MPAESNHLLLQVDQYIEALCSKQDDALLKAIEDSDRAGLPQIHVSPNEGKLLYMLARLSGAKRILEIGLLGGYSAIWLARALPKDGKLISLELEEKHAQVARKNIDRAGLGSKVEIRVGPALDGLKKIAQAKEEPFDLVFIDADKTAYPEYLDWSLKLTRPGSVILADNVIRNGKVVGNAPGDASVEAVRIYNRRVAEDPRLEALLLPLMRESLDGLAIARVK